MRSAFALAAFLAATTWSWLAPNAPSGALGVVWSCGVAVILARGLFVVASEVLVRPRAGHAQRSSLPYALAAIFALRFLARAWNAPGPWENDAAYYFGVARHIALTHRFEEPIVWHLLDPPIAVPHAPFDYWCGLLPATLVGPMMAFGPTYRVAAVTMAVISSLALLGVAHLTSLMTRTLTVQLLVVALFATSPWLLTTRIDTETAPLFHLLLVAALVAFAHRRYAQATVLAFGLFLVRTDGVMVCTLLWATCLLRGKRVNLAAVMVGLMSAWMLANLAIHGHAVPPALREVEGLQRRAELYAFGEHVAPALRDVLRADLAPSYFLGRMRFLAAFMTRLRFTPHSLVWLALGAAVLLRWRKSLDVTRVTAVALVGGGILLAWLSPREVFSPARSLSMLIPLVVLFGGAGVDTILRACDRHVTSVRRRALASVVTALLLAPFAFGLEPNAPDPPRHDFDAELRALAPRLGTDVVLTTLPWQVISWTDARAVAVPSNGAPAIEEVARLYGAKWLLMGRPNGWVGASADVLSAIDRGDRTAIGTIALVAEDADALRLYSLVVER